MSSAVMRSCASDAARAESPSPYRPRIGRRARRRLPKPVERDAAFGLAGDRPGTSARSKPSLAASLSRSAPWATGRSSPDSATSPNTTASAGTGRSRQRRDQRRGDGEVGGGIGQPIAAGDVEIDFGGREAEAAARLQHRQDHRQPPAIPADRGAARGRAARQPDGQRLDLDQHRPRAFQRREDDGAADRLAAVGEEQRRRVGDLGQPRAFHREHADLVGAAEAVLGRAQDAILVAALAFEAEHRVDHMFEHARPGDRCRPW